MDVRLFISYWIRKREGRASWLNWLEWQPVTLVENEQDDGLELCNWFLGDDDGQKFSND